MPKIVQNLELDIKVTEFGLIFNFSTKLILFNLSALLSAFSI